ncbi:apoptosis-enhancing nuclease isoform X2 [Talpa occidentalis]|uniref:apoptosis-enhancing nuclease isoform X2 n=1 Tax=Talpa occidentalis TaxID=50954 RepID=UPI00188E61C4|nr:apoptosis-enhancing nuclease isoform X2 [Talpa occidentalis]
MVSRETTESAQGLCPPLAGLNAKDVPRRKHKRKSRQHQRFLAHKALLQEQGLLSAPPALGLRLAPSEMHPRAESGGAPASKKPARKEAAAPWPSKCVAIDCEMVGTGPRGRILKLLKGKVVVGHALHNDFQALKYVHPRSHTRDTTHVPTLLSQPGTPARTRVSLKDLALQLLHKKIQVGQHGHSSVEDAMTAMELYRLVETRWEQQASSLHPGAREPDSSPDMEKYMEDQYWPEDLT